MSDDDTFGNGSPSGALARGLRVLVAVNDLDTATVSRIVAESALPKATVIRLLQTLQSEGYLDQDPETLTWRVTPKVASLSRAIKGKDETESLIQVALDMLADEIKWPAEYLAVDGLSMLILSNNRERAPIKVKLFERRRFPILGSAAGIAYLSTLPEAEAARLVDRTAANADERARAEAAIARARAEGYAFRGLPELGPNMVVASVPVPEGGGAVSLVHFDDVVAREHLEAVILPRLRDCARNIALARRGVYPRGTLA